MSGGIGHVLLMLQSVKNNRNLVKKRKSFNGRKKNFDNNPFSKEPDDAQLTDAMNIHKKHIRFYERYSSIWGLILLGLVVILIMLYIFDV